MRSGFDVCRKLCSCISVLNQKQCETLMSLSGTTFTKLCRTSCRVDDFVYKVRLCAGVLLDRISDVLRSADLSVWLESETESVEDDFYYVADKTYAVHSGPWLH